MPTAHRHLCWLACLLALTACDAAKDTSMQQPPAPEPPAPVEAVAQPVSAVPDSTRALFQPVPARVDAASGPATEAQINLGRQLYYDVRMSKNHDVSCNTCHLLNKYGIDGLPTSQGHRQQKGDRNAPTVYNAAGHFAQFWDGREPTVEAQAKGPPLNPIEMAMKNEAAVVAMLESIPGYVEAFAEAFPDQNDPVTFDNFGNAIGAFERGLITQSRFDAYLAGNETALSPEQLEGLNIFVETGCTACHSGTWVGGNSYQKVGMVKPWPNQEDKGRGKVTGNPADEMFFKVPSLRNVERTAPYFHDGSVPNLPLAVRMMAEHQLGKALSDEEVASIVIFLRSLTGSLPARYISPPQLPPSGPKTPAPDPT